MNIEKNTWLETNLECKVKSTFLFFRAISPKLGEVVVKSQIKWKRKVSEQILHQPPSSCTQRQLLHRKTKILHQTSENHKTKTNQLMIERNFLGTTTSGDLIPITGSSMKASV